MQVKDYYDILEVSKAASQDEIQSAYRKLARKYHPDVNPDDSAAEERFKELGEAYEVLKDSEKRAAYDQYGSAWKAAQQAGGATPSGVDGFEFDLSGMSSETHSSFSDFLGDLFGAGRRWRSTWQDNENSAPSWSWEIPGADREATLALTLEEAAEGGQREITLTEPSTGQPKTYMVTIPPGMQPGQRIRLAQQGEAGHGEAPPGDLYLKVKLLPHDRFRLKGRDLYTPLSVTPWEAMLGAEVRLPTLKGEVAIKIPPGTSSGRTMRLKGKGYPDRRHGAGDLYAEIKIVVPEELTESETELLEKLAQVSSFEPRSS